MTNKPLRYREFEQVLTVFLLIDLVLFIGYLVFAGMGLVAAKIIFCILTMLGAGYCLWILWNIKEIFRQRSLWFTCAFGSIILCTLVSLIANYPAP